MVMGRTECSGFGLSQPFFLIKKKIEKPEKKFFAHILIAFGFYHRAMAIRTVIFAILVLGYVVRLFQLLSLEK